MVYYSVRDEIIEVVNKLFVYTDMQDWEKLKEEVFTHEVLFDMSSLGGENAEKTSEEICFLWKDGFKGIDAIHHQAGNYIVQIHETTATVFAYATATHFKEKAMHGKTREFVGSYELALMKHGPGWRIYQFKYILKYMTGNSALT